MSHNIQIPRMGKLWYDKELSRQTIFSRREQKHSKLEEQARKEHKGKEK